MIKKIKLLSLLLFFCCFKSVAQSFYVSASIDPNYSPGGSNVYKVTVLPGGGVSSELVNACTYSQYFSLAMSGNNLYWIDQAYLLKANIDGINMTNCAVAGSIPIYSNALTAGADGNVYYTGTNLYSTNPVTMETRNLGAMSYYASGDITFYNGDLYMASAGGIVKIDINNTANSYMYMPLPANLNLFGLVSVATSLHKNTVYALSAVSTTRTDIIEIDLDNKVIKGVVGSLPYSVLDAASPVENGSINGIVINKINVRQDCDAPNKGIVEVITTPSLNPLTYKLSSTSTTLTNTTGVFTAVPAGNYQLTVTSSVDQQTASVVVPAYNLNKPQYNYTIKDQVCDQLGEIAFKTTDASSTYLVRAGSDVFPINHTFTGLVTGTPYHFDILNENGCKVDGVDINVPKDKCTIKFNRVDVQKQCDALTLGVVQVITNPHTDQYTYALNGISNTTGMFSNLSQGSYSITITSAEDQIIVPAIVPDYKLTAPVINYSYTVKDQVCDQAGEIAFKAPVGGTQYQIRLDSDVFPINHTFTGLATGVPYHFDILNQDGCKAGEVDISVPKDKCTIKFNKVDVQQQCDAIHKGVLQVVTNPHYDQYTYTLNGISNTTGTFSNLPAGSYTINIISPEDAISVPVVVPDYKLTQPAIGYLATDPACAAKGSIKFSMPGSSTGYTIKYGADTYPFDHIFDGLSSGSYNFTVADPKGCLIDQYTVELKYQPCPIVINAINFTAECYAFGKAVVQVVTPPIPETYSYTLNGVTNGTGIFNLLDPGSYTLLITASGGGTPQNRTVTVPDFKLDRPTTVIKTVSPVCELLGQISLAVGTNAKLYDVSYNNSVYPSDHVFKDLTAGTYEFNILKKDGCIADVIDVDLVMEMCSPVSFPSAFTPNNDGINDVFQADPKSKATNFKLQIYNRWGQMIYTSTDLHAGWDGRFNGGVCAVGTYYWVATFINQENKPAMQKGYVTLIR